MFYLQKESEFFNEYRDAAFVIGSADFFCAKTEDDDKINVIIICIAYKDIENNYIEKNKKIILRMKIYEKELDYYKNIIKIESVVKLKVRCEKEQFDDLEEFLIADIIDNNYKDEDLNKILKEYLKPIYYNDDMLGDFLYNRKLGSFDKNLEWINNKKVFISFDDSNDNDKSVIFLRDIFFNREEFDKKIKYYCALKIADVYKKNASSNIDDGVFIENFVKKVDILDIAVHKKDNYVNYRLGNNKVFDMDIIVQGDLNGSLFNAFISSI